MWCKLDCVRNGPVRIAQFAPLLRARGCSASVAATWCNFSGRNAITQNRFSGGRKNPPRLARPSHLLRFIDSVKMTEECNGGHPWAGVGGVGEGSLALFLAISFLQFCVCARACVIMKPKHWLIPSWFPSVWPHFRGCVHGQYPGRMPGRGQSGTGACW